MRHYYNIFALMFTLCKDLWSKKNRGIHYHIVAFDTEEEFKVIFDHLHKAHVGYNKKLGKTEPYTHPEGYKCKYCLKKGI